MEVGGESHDEVDEDDEGRDGVDNQKCREGVANRRRHVE